MSATSAAVPIASVSPRPVWLDHVRTWADTPHVLLVGVVVIWVASLGLVLAGNASLAEARRTIQTIGRDTAPSIVAAQSMKASMVDMDANAANDLLGGPNGVQAARDTYNTDRAAAVAGLIRAARNITYDSGSATQSMKAATDLMHQQILPAADQLDAVNFDHLTATYADRKQTAGLSLALVLIAGVLVVALLVVVQVFLARRTRRVLNLPLLGATVVALLLTGRLVSTLNAETTDLKVAKQDAFDSVHYLWQARAIAYDANGDESLWLLPGFDKPQYDASFHAKTAELVDRPLTDQLIASAAAGNVQFKGRFADEMNNITFPGELEAATQMLRTYRR